MVKPLPKSLPKPIPKGSTPVKSKGYPRGYHGAEAIRGVVFGPPGIGKTSWASAWPNTGFICDRNEMSIIDLVRFKQADEPLFVEPVSSWGAVLEQLELIKRNRPCQTLVLESILGLERLSHIHHCEDAFDGDWSDKGFMSFNKGPKQSASRVWVPFLEQLEDIRNVGINVLLLGHSAQKTYQNPTGPDYDEFTCQCDKATWAETNKWADLIVFYRSEVDLEGKQLKKKIRVGTEDRVLYLSPCAAWPAKNRFGLPPSIVVGESYKEAYQSFESAFLKLMS